MKGPRMAKRKRCSKCPQPRHKQAGSSSQYDKRSRLDKANRDRRKTESARIPLVGWLATAAASMADLLDSRMAFRLSILMAGMLLADDRRVAASWFAAAGVGDDWDRFYDCLMSVGRKTGSLALPLVMAVVRKLDPGPQGRIVLAGDDSPTQRYGKQVEGAGVHHNPTPGPADGEWLYGHNWVTLCVLGKHPLWGILALPLRSLLYVREQDVPALQQKYGWEFRTKHELLVDLVEWFVGIVRGMELQCAIWLAVDGAYAARPVLQPLIEQGVVIFSRLRKDAVLYELPQQPKPGQRGRPRIYGAERISLAKRAAHKCGWQTIAYVCRGVEVTRQYKSFLATCPMTGGVIRVVIVRFEDRGWAAYFCTNPDVSIRDLLETVAARWAIEEHFHDVKEVWGAGQQQVRNLWSNIACWNLNQWMYTLVELATWDSSHAELVDRSDRPWDCPSRRPSHADRRRTIARNMLEERFLATLPDSPETEKFKRLIADVVQLCV